MLSDLDIKMVRDMLQMKIDAVAQQIKDLADSGDCSNHIYFLNGKYEAFVVAREMFSVE